MTFIRRVRTKSGATAVQVARYVNGRQEIVKHIGSAHTDIDLGILLERARSWIDPGQQVLDLGVTPQPPVASVLPAGQGVLLPAADQRPAVDALGRTASTGSVVLRQVFETVYDQLGSRFVTTTAKGRSLDTASIERARSLVGLKGYVTNIPATLMAPSEVIGKYHDLWHVEQSFRQGPGKVM